MAARSELGGRRERSRGWDGNNPGWGHGERPPPPQKRALPPPHLPRLPACLCGGFFLGWGGFSQPDPRVLGSGVGGSSPESQIPSPRSELSPGLKINPAMGPVAAGTSGAPKAPRIPGKVRDVRMGLTAKGGGSERITKEFGITLIPLPPLLFLPVLLALLGFFFFFLVCYFFFPFSRDIWNQFPALTPKAGRFLLAREKQNAFGSFSPAPLVTHSRNILSLHKEKQLFQADPGDSGLGEGFLGRFSRFFLVFSKRGRRALPQLIPPGSFFILAIL